MDWIMLGIGRGKGLVEVGTGEFGWGRTGGVGRVGASMSWGDGKERLAVVAVAIVAGFWVVGEAEACWVRL
jgi:hypothetical protein